MCVGGGGGVLCVCLNMPVYELGIGLWPGRGGLNIGASRGEDRYFLLLPAAAGATGYVWHTSGLRPVASQPGGGGSELGWVEHQAHPPPPLDIVRVTSSI